MNPPNFNRVAHVYRWAEYAALGPLLQRVRTHFLPQLTPVREALGLGDGDGRFLRAFLQANTAAHVTAVDGSSAMLRLLQQRTSFAAHRVRTQLADFHAFEPQGSYDLVVTHFALDCLSQREAEALIQRVTTCTHPGTLWLVSDFGLPQTPVARTAARLYIRALYAAFRILTGLRTQQLPDHASALAGAGFVCIERKQWLQGFLFTELWQRL